MKLGKIFRRIFLCISLLAIIFSCESDAENYEDYYIGDNTPTPCNYIQWSGTGNCNTGYYPVYTNTCAPENFPFYNTATDRCYSTCSAAYNANPNGEIYRYNEDGNGGNNECNYTQWTGTGSCNSGYYPVFTNVCAPANYPFYNTATNLCYANCSAAYSANPAGQIYRYNEDGNGGNGNTSQIVFWTATSQYGQIQIYVNGTYEGTITNTYSGAPSCGATGCVTVPITGTGNTWSATAGNYTWDSTALTLTSACMSMQLY